LAIVSRVSIWEYIIIDMGYMCKGCNTFCSNIAEHLRKKHGFSASYIKDFVITKSNSYKHCFEEIK